jgi:hypothetical protein
LFKADIGSALVVRNQTLHRWFQIGITSSEFNVQAVEYARVSSFIKWILNVIQNN